MISSNSLLISLNEKQKIAVLSDHQYLRIVAGAGTGKTSVLTKKIAYIVIEKKAYPNQILALTFTNKAAIEMKERLQSLIGEKAKDVNMFTFHSLCNLILKYEGKNLSKISQIPINDGNFNIIDDRDQKNILRTIYDKLEISADEISYGKSLDFISKNKNKQVSLQDIEQEDNDDNSSKSKFIEIYKLYLQETAELGVVDFDDLQIYVKILFENNQEIAKKWQQKMKYVLVDEFQDTSSIQYDILKFFIKKETKLVVVGDPDQTIYSWRGAEPGLILNLEQDFPELKTVVLDLNYRSNQSILDAANQLIANNKNRIEKNLHSHKEWKDELEVKFYHGSTAQDEADWVINQIWEIANKEKSKFREIAILYRNHSYIRTIEDALVKKGIPHGTIGRKTLQDRKEIREIMHFWKVIESGDNFSFQQIINVPPKKIGISTLTKLNDLAKSYNYNLHDFLLFYYSGNIKLKLGDKIPLSNENQKKISTLFSNINWAKGKKLEIENKNNPKIKQFSLIMKLFLKGIGYLEQVRDTKEKNDIEKLLEAYYIQLDEWQKHNPNKNLRDYIDDISLDSQLDFHANNSVKLMTIHSSKGLEFDNVFVVGMVQGIFPSIQILKSKKNTFQEEYEEERRLAFVAITRARNKLFISDANIARLRPDNNNRDLGETSRFVREMKIKSQQIQQFTKFDIQGKLNYINANNVEYHQGEFVKHIKFGKGQILEVQDNFLVIKFLDLDGKNAIKTIMKQHKSIEKI
ncbi:ATP-dependent helicase [Mesomycoplasma conjunctivae]|uniref:ATP-dependent helicase n=1 Tax=Mesomycoplasma conjunctivae TaxID=45361 RepID=UPI003DA28625